MNITLTQKRFLIVWILFHSFALFVNQTKLKGTVITDEYNKKYYRREIRKHLLTGDTLNEKFWPFTRYKTYQTFTGIADTTFFIYQGRRTPTFINTYRIDINHRNGIFTSYDFSEFIFYILLGLGIIVIPKLWNNNNNIKKNGGS